MASSRCVRTDTVTGSLMDSRSTRSCGRGQPCREGPTISGGEPCLTRGGRERDQQLEALEVERLGNVGENVTRERLARYPAVVVAGQHENARLRTQAAHLREELETTHARHVDVEQHQIEPIALERREGLVAVDRERDLVLVVVPEPAENVPQYPHGRRIVVDDQDALGRTRVTRGVVDGYLRDLPRGFVPDAWHRTGRGRRA